MPEQPDKQSIRVSRQRILLSCRAAGLVFLGLGLPLTIRFLAGIYQIAAAVVTNPNESDPSGFVGMFLHLIGSKNILFGLVFPNLVGLMSVGMGVYLLKRTPRKIVEWTEARA